MNVGGVRWCWQKSWLRFRSNWLFPIHQTFTKIKTNSGGLRTDCEIVVVPTSKKLSDPWVIAWRTMYQLYKGQLVEWRQTDRRTDAMPLHYAFRYGRGECINCTCCLRTRASAAADRPARRRGSVHAKHSVSHHMVIKQFLLLGLATEYRSRPWVWSTVARRPSELYDTHRRTKLTAPETICQPFQKYGWCPQKFKWFTWPNHTHFGMVCHPWASTCYLQPTYQIWRF